MDIKTAIRDQFYLCLDGLKLVKAGSHEFDFFYECIYAYKSYIENAKYYEGLSFNKEKDE